MILGLNVITNTWHTYVHRHPASSAIPVLFHDLRLNLCQISDLQVPAAVATDSLCRFASTQQDEQCHAQTALSNRARHHVNRALVTQAQESIVSNA